jgi:hypothetical protein
VKQQLRPTPASREPLPPTSKLILGVEILVTYARARRLLARRGLEDALGALRGTSVPITGRPEAAAVHAGIRLGRAVTRTLTAARLDSRCLMTSLVLTGLLARRGLVSSLVIGVRPAEEFGAHAWVELNGKPLLPVGAAAQDEPAFERLVAV